MHSALKWSRSIFFWSSASNIWSRRFDPDSKIWSISNDPFWSKFLVNFDFWHRIITIDNCKNNNKLPFVSARKGDNFFQVFYNFDPELQNLIQNDWSICKKNDPRDLIHFKIFDSLSIFFLSRFQIFDPFQMIFWIRNPLDHFRALWHS